MRVGVVAAGVQALKHDVRFLGLLDGHHLNLLVVLGADDFGEGGLADLTLEFSEVVGSSETEILLLNLVINPGLQTPHMNQPTIPLTLARRH